MFIVSEEENRITFIISSELRLVDRIVLEAREFLKEFDVNGDSDFKLALREILNNAIEHGNKNNTDKKVTLTINHLDSKRFLMDVLDEGDGFDYNTLELSLSQDPKQVRSRGFSLINTCCDEIAFNEKGNKITAYVTFTDETRFKITEQDGTTVITPSGNLTAHAAEKFQEKLVQLHEKKIHNITFDLENVEDIDSVCLSVLILLAKTVTKHDETPHLTIRNANKDLIHLFHMTRMDDIYKIEG